MKSSYLLNYFVCTSLVISSFAGNFNVEAKSIAVPGAANTGFTIAQNNPSGYSPGYTLASPTNQANGNASNTSGYSAGDTFGSSSNQTPGAARKCCNAKAKLIQDCLYLPGSAGSDNPGSTSQNPFAPKTDLNPQPLPPEHPGSIPWIPPVTNPRITMLLYGDGVSTSKATLELSCAGQTTTISLQTICASGKTKRPWPTKEAALRGHIQYQLGLTDPQLMNIVQAASEQDAQGMYSKLAIAPERRLQTMTQLGVWMYESRVTGNPADAVTPQAVASDICEQSHTSLSSLSAADNKELTGHVMDMLMAADATEKHSHETTWQPPPDVPPPQIPPPVETTQPGTPSYGGSPPWELVCIPAGTRFFTSDCRYQTVMVIRCAYGRCPICPGSQPSGATSTPPASTTNTADNASTAPTTALTTLPNSQPMGTSRANYLAALGSLKQRVLNSPKVNTPEGQKLLGAINNVENPSVGISNSSSAGAVSGASNNVLPGRSTALTLPQNFTAAQLVNIPAGLAGAAAAAAAADAAAQALADALAPGASLQQVQTEAQQVDLQAQQAAAAAQQNAAIVGLAESLFAGELSPENAKLAQDAANEAQAAAKAQQQADTYAQLAQQATNPRQAQRYLKQEAQFEQQAQQDAQQAAADLQQFGGL